MMDHWQAVADRWAQVGPPLRPSESDVEVFGSLISLGSPVRAVVLGVTPEIVGLPWAEGSAVVAVDHTEAMIRAVWPGHSNVSSNALLGDWRGLPLRAGTFDLVFCDGGLHLLDYPMGQRKLAKEIFRVLKGGGRLAIRWFLPPDQPENIEVILEDLSNGRTPNLNVLKLRLGQCLCCDPAEGILVSEVFRIVAGLAPSLDDLADRLGWDRAHLRAIESYRDSLNRYHFVSLEEAIALFGNSAGGLVLEKVVPGKGVMGDQCPIAIWRKDEVA